MMRQLAKILVVTSVIAIALAVVSAAGASAAPRFTASATGTLHGKQTSQHVFTTSAGSTNQIECSSAETSGTIVSLESAEQHATILVSGCIAKILGFSVAATVSPITANLTANGSVHLLNTVTIHVGGIANCDINIGPQTPTGAVSYINSSGKIAYSIALTGIVSTSTGICPSGTNGTLVGSGVIERVGGGTLAWDSV